MAHAKNEHPKHAAAASVAAANENSGAELAAEKAAQDAHEKLVATVKAKVDEIEALLEKHIDSVPPDHVLKPVHVKILALAKSLHDDVAVPPVA